MKLTTGAKNMHSYLTTTIASICLLASFPVYPDEVRYYDIELIIFESTNPVARTSEVWKKDLETEIPQVYVELGQPYPGPIPTKYDPKQTFKKLSKRNYRLSADVKILVASKNYNILYHTAWRQPGMSANVALPVHIHQEYITRQERSDPYDDPDMPAVNLPTPLSNVERKRSILDGYIKIILSRYLHAEVDFNYTTGLPPTSTILLHQEDLGDESVMPVFYKIKQSRRMRSKEVHYLDHPVVGVIILATPYDNKALKPIKKKG